MDKQKQSRTIQLAELFGFFVRNGSFLFSLDPGYPHLILALYALSPNLALPS